MKGRDVLSICRSCVESAFPEAINTMPGVNQKSKEKEACTKKQKRMNEAVAAGHRVPRKKSQFLSVKRLRYEWVHYYRCLD